MVPGSTIAWCTIPTSAIYTTCMYNGCHIEQEFNTHAHTDTRHVKSTNRSNLKEDLEHVICSRSNTLLIIHREHGSEGFLNGLEVSFGGEVANQWAEMLFLEIMEEGLA